MLVVISLNDYKLERFLVSPRINFHYIYCGERNKEILKLLNERSFQEIQLEKIDEEDKKALTEAYIELVGSLGRKYNSIFWWVNYLSSKNKFISKLFPDLVLLYSIVLTIRNNLAKDILIINPPVGIYRSLLIYFRLSLIEVEILTDLVKNFTQALCDIPRSVKSTLLLIYSYWKRIYISRKYLSHKFNTHIQPNEKYYVLRSWFYPSSIDAENKYVDSFFGQLPQYLTQEGVKLIVVAGDQGDYELIVKKIANEKDFFIVTQEYFLKYSDPLKAALSIFMHRIRIKDRICLNTFDVTDIVKEEIRKLNSYSLTLESYLYRYITRGMLRHFSIDTFTTTYENNPWERVTFWILRKYSPQTKIIGYQHSVLSKAHVNMLLGKGEIDIVPLPDRVITIGKVTREILVNQGNYPPEIVREGCGLRFEHIFKLREKVHQKTFNILVTPEGVLTESVNLFDFVYKALKDCHKHKIILRPHPALPFQNLKGHLCFDTNSTSNFIVSTHSYSKDDLNEADVVIYRGSALSLEALKMGIPVIYVSLRDDILSVDPMHECHYLKWSVRDEQELRDALNAAYSMGDEAYQANLIKANSYLKNYVHEITEERLREFIL